MGVGVGILILIVSDVWAESLFLSISEVKSYFLYLWIPIASRDAP
jgi:hypothetical protein